MRKFLKHIFFSVSILGLSFITFGQRVRPYVPTFRPSPNFQNRVAKPNPERKFEVIRENFMGRQLNLTREETQRFWPVYRQYQDAITAVRRLKRINNSSSQPDGTDQINKELYYESELVNIRRYYRDEFLKILPPEKVSIIYKSEREFTDELIRQLHERSEPVKN